MKRFNIVVNGRAYDVQVDEMAPGAPAPAPVPAAMPSAIPSPVPSPVGYAAPQITAIFGVVASA